MSNKPLDTAAIRARLDALLQATVDTVKVKATFYGHAPDDIRALLDEVERLRAVMAALERFQPALMVFPLYSPDVEATEAEVDADEISLVASHNQAVIQINAAFAALDANRKESK